MEDFDMVSDLNGTGDTTVAVHEKDSSTHGTDAVNVNNRAPVQQPTKVDTDVKTPVDGDEVKKPLSLRDQISSSLKGETNTPAAASQDGLVRDPITGQFAPKVEVLDPNAAPVEAAPPVAAPAGIDPQVFQSLPAETQAHLARTMDDIAQGQQRVARLDQVEQLIAPRRDAWALNGMSEATAIHQLLALSDFAGRDPQGFIKYMAEVNQVDLEEMVLGQEPVDPQYKALQDQIKGLQDQVQGGAQQQQAIAHQRTVDSVVAFATEKGQDGQPVRPYFDEVVTDIMPFITMIKNQNPQWPNERVLQEAYDRATWANPTVRSKMQKMTATVSDAQKLREQTERVERARTASASVKSGIPTSAPVAPDDTSRDLRSTIRNAISQHQS